MEIIHLNTRLCRNGTTEQKKNDEKKNENKK